MMKHATGFEVRADKEGLVLDGDQKVQVYLSIGYAGIETERIEETLKDGMLLTNAIEYMDQEADTMLASSPVEYGWFVKD